jgi:hypothetical protein
VTLTGDEPVRVFLSHAATEDVSELASMLRRLGHAVEVPEALWGPQSFSELSLEAIRSANVLVAVLDGPSANVLVEVGVAVGVGTPVVLLLSSDIRFGRELDTLPRVRRPDDLENLNEAIVRAALARPDRNVDRELVHRPALNPEVANEFQATLRDRSTDPQGIERLVVRLFESSGAKVLRQPNPEPGSTPLARPDLVIWHDDLNASFGLPLPVEILVRTFAPEAMLPRLRRTLNLSGAQSLLALSALSSPPIASVEGDRTVVVVSLGDLVEYLANYPLGQALGLLRAQATLIGVPR